LNGRSVVALAPPIHSLKKTAASSTGAMKSSSKTTSNWAAIPSDEVSRSAECQGFVSDETRRSRHSQNMNIT